MKYVLLVTLGFIGISLTGMDNNNEEWNQMSFLGLPIAQQPVNPQANRINQLKELGKRILQNHAPIDYEKYKKQLDTSDFILKGPMETHISLSSVIKSLNELDRDAAQNLLDLAKKQLRKEHTQYQQAKNIINHVHSDTFNAKKRKLFE